MHPRLSSLALAAGLAVCQTSAFPFRHHASPRDLQATNSCPPYTKGTLVVEAYQLYPENADWDAKRCVVYYG